MEEDLKNLGIIDEMSAYDSFDEFYTNFLNYKQNMFEKYMEAVDDLSKKYSREDLEKVYNLYF